MDEYTDSHFKAWLERTVFEADRGLTEHLMRAFLDEYPDLLAEGRNWPEIRRLADAWYEELIDSKFPNV